MNDTSLPTPSRAGTHRARWAALGAAVAVSLGAGGFGIANAIVTENPKNVYVAISPCRLIDTRPGELNTGPRATPLGANETWTIAGTGDVAGPCNLPAGIKALELNVTAVNATVPTYLTLYPTGVARPLASNLNPTPGQPPTPNSVTVTLANDGNFDLYNLTGTVDIVIDVVGYYDDHRHSSADITNDAGVSFDSTIAATVLGTNTVVVDTTIRVPSDGFLTIEASGYYQPTGGATDQAVCQLTLNSATADLTEEITFVTAETLNFAQNLSLHRTLPIEAADNPVLIGSGQVARLICSNTSGTGSIGSAHLTATFHATEYEPSFIIFPFADGDAEG